MSNGSWGSSPEPVGTEGAPAEAAVVAGRPQLLRAMNEESLVNALRRRARC